MSKVQICNRGASQYLGLPRINSFSETSPQAEQYNLHYDDLRKRLLERHWWIFAKDRSALATLATNPRSNDWKYAYQKPATAIEIHWVNDQAVAEAAMSSHQNPDAPRQMAGTSIFSNQYQAYCEYTDNVKNTELMPQYFRDALSAMVAAAIALPMTESVQKAKFASEQAELMVDKAIAEDENNATVIEMPGADYIEERQSLFADNRLINTWE